ncbi:DUF1758 domain-containing protein [Trichonephila clavata]|uniref:DUF1758 domain-containing protein n=1 Tax=Trichonephila clavata TaxID=2740835 RepID=A0A8X6JB31_TRICU|nr:DUF1758 domain-containing protein [Trichonephila clavata]
MSETEKAQVAQIRIARGRVKASMTRLESSFDELNTKNEISIRLSRLDGLFKEFERLDSTLSLEESELEEFEERYFNLSAKFNDKLDELNVLNLSGTQNSVASSITSNSNVSNFRLPKLSIPQFSGNFKDWINFKDLFVSTVHSQISLPNIEKFQYLKGLLTHEPASLITHIPLSNDSYEEAGQKLLDSGKIVGSKNEPIAQRTMFGWVVAGKLNIKNKEPNELYSHFLSTENDLKTDSLLQRFWETEELSVKKQFLSDEELFCEDHFQSTFKYNDQADVQQMYRQILVDREDQNLQLIVWRESKDSPIRENKLCTVTYGTASAPYLATRCLFQVGLELERDNPTVSSLIKESFYIDDLMAGATSSEEAITSIKTLSQVLEARRFHLRKWRSNSPDVLSRISSNWVGDTSNLEIHPDECSKALGLTWNSVKDTFIFNLKVNFPDNITKRSFLSQSARLFDTLGFLTPCTVSIKIFYQQLWLLKLDWDSPFPDALATKWKTFRKKFEQICSIHIPRWIHTVSQQVTLHGFCDASELAYASVIHAVQPQADGNTKVTLLVAKSRVAPLKPVSIPRLELNGALLLARLYATCKNIFQEYDVHLHAWTDSQVVLSWLSSHPRNWKPYIANRTSEILDLVPADSWRYVPTKMNPADIACRGLSPKKLPRCGLWWEGPQWLSCGVDSWPKQPKRDDQTSLVTKERKRTAFSFPVSVNCDFIDSLFLKFSSFSKIIDIFAFCFRYITNCKARVGKMKSNLDFKGKCHVPPLTTYERRKASNKNFLYIQNLFFKEEINCLKANKPVASKSIRSALCPFIDKDGLIRVGGRLRNSTLQYSAKHPIILPNQHEICNLIVNMYHILYLHAGCNVLLGIIKQTYWIIGIKKIVKKCIVCCRYRATTSKQLMGDPPAHRVTPSRPFSACGVDYAGPINVLRYRDTLRVVIGRLSYDSSLVPKRKP